MIVDIVVVIHARFTAALRQNFKLLYETESDHFKAP